MLSIQLDGEAHVGTTDTPIVLAVLATALITRLQWLVELDVSAERPPTIGRVRVQDDRSNFCLGGNISTRPDGIALRPLTPTAFADEEPPKWGFFFALGTKCAEYKATSLDVYEIVAAAWLKGRLVALTFDDDNRIVGAEQK
jgi:hypothetical protein